MDPITISGIFALGKTAIEKFFPDPTKRAAELRKLEELRQKGDLAELQAHVQLTLAQIEVNKTEAGHKSVFVAGWRPAVGWVCASALAWHYFVHPLLTWVAAAADFTPPPSGDMGDLIILLGGLLGLGGLRTYERRNGVQSDTIRANNS